MSDCLFCKIAGGDVPADVIYRDEDCLAFRDVNPVAPTHVLVVPLRHIATTNDLGPEDAELIGRITLAAQKIARDEGVDQAGYRLVWNCNKDAGQTVFHIHLHLLAGRSFQWPPG